mmetsp:Transcript_20784/g.36657  ORF Transcript_20784/g.36657 Transcript_20784/m.36657 type:complete len:253 (+) Transcript_20784:361-1119(+)
MEKAIVSNSNINEGAEGNHIPHDTFQSHARLQLLHTQTYLLGIYGICASRTSGDRSGESTYWHLHTSGLQAAAWIHSASKCCCNICQCLGSDFQLYRQALHFITCRLQATDITSKAPLQFTGNAVALRMHWEFIKWLAATMNSKKAYGLMKCTLTNSTNSQQVVTATECAMLTPMADDCLRQGCGEPGDMLQQHRGGRVEVHPNGVHTILGATPKLLSKASLVHIMLVQANTDTLGVNLHQFRQRIEQPPCN